MVISILKDISCFLHTIHLAILVRVIWHTETILWQLSTFISNPFVSDLIYFEKIVSKDVIAFLAHPCKRRNFSPHEGCLNNII